MSCSSYFLSLGSIFIANSVVAQETSVSNRSAEILSDFQVFLFRVSRGIFSSVVNLEGDSRIVYSESSRMKAFCQLGTVILLLASYLTPAMACMVSDVQMNAEERACCRVMQNQCEQMGMSASHDCCQKTPRIISDSALDTKAVTYHPITVAAVIWLTAADWLHPKRMITGEIEQSGYSPPKSLPSFIPVLRI